MFIDNVRHVPGILKEIDLVHVHVINCKKNHAHFLKRHLSKTIQLV